MAIVLPGTARDWPFGTVAISESEERFQIVFRIKRNPLARIVFSFCPVEYLPLVGSKIKDIAFFCSDVERVLQSSRSQVPALSDVQFPPAIWQSLNSSQNSRIFPILHPLALPEFVTESLYPPVRYSNRWIFHEIPGSLRYSIPGSLLNPSLNPCISPWRSDNPWICHEISGSPGYPEPGKITGNWFLWGRNDPWSGSKIFYIPGLKIHFFLFNST